VHIYLWWDHSLHVGRDLHIPDKIGYCGVSGAKPSFEFDTILFLQCQTLVDELSASQSTDLQQRAYELQALLGLDKHAVESVMPSDASCEDIEVLIYFH
jgi:hypothetical protein